MQSWPGKMRIPNPIWPATRSLSGRPLRPAWEREIFVVGNVTTHTLKDVNIDEDCTPV